MNVSMVNLIIIFAIRHGKNPNQVIPDGPELGAAGDFRLICPRVKSQFAFCRDGVAGFAG
jgi:hypothetical protein